MIARNDHSILSLMTFKDLPIGATFTNKHGATYRKLPDAPNGAGRAYIVRFPGKPALADKICTYNQTYRVTHGYGL